MFSGRVTSCSLPAVSASLVPWVSCLVPLRSHLTPLRSNHERPRNSCEAESEKAKGLWKVNYRPCSIKYLLQLKLEGMGSSFEIQNTEITVQFRKASMKFEHRLSEESGSPFTNKQTLAFNVAKTFNSIKSVWPTLTDCSVPFPRLYLPIHGPQWWFGHRGHTCDNFSCSQFHCVASWLEQQQAYGPERTTGGGGEAFSSKRLGYYSLILRVVVPRFLLLIPESRRVMNRFSQQPFWMWK